MITWTNTTIKLADLVPWERNPRTMTKRQAQRLLKSWRDLGQFQTVAIGPHGEVYDGYQRLSALLTAYGPQYVIDARQSNRELSEDERRYLITQANLPVGDWRFEDIAGWPEAQEWGFDAEMLATWNKDAANLRELINADLPPNDIEAEWEGMPEFEQEDLRAYKSIHVNFPCREDYEAFAKLIDQKLTDKTRSIWYPPVDKINMTDTYEHKS